VDTGPEVSIVVSSYNRAGRLDGVVRSLLAQRDVDLEAVVVDNGSTDDTWAVLQRLEAELDDPRLRLVRREVNAGPSGGRNAGWRAARGVVVAFTDDDCVPHDDWAARLTAPIRRGELDLTQGRTDAAGDPLPRDGWTREFRIPGVTGWYETCNIAYRRSLLEAMDGFDERFRQSGEDTDLALRSLEHGARFAWIDEAVVEHERSTVTFKQILRARRQNVSLAQLLARHPGYRDRLVLGVFWRPGHIRVLGGLAALVFGRLLHPIVPLLVALGWASWKGRRYIDAPVPRRVALGAGDAVADVYEVAMTVRGSVEARTLLL
jgi:glycosyltransferase involved in cell wall biosynthesis